MTARLDPSTDPVLVWAQAERERLAVTTLGEDLAAVDIEFMVFKGIHLAFAIAPSPDFRLCLDADVLLAPNDFERAAARLRALSTWSVDDGNWSTYGALHVPTGAYVDLHRIPLPPRFGRFDVAAARARARTLERAFGPHVLVPDPLDAAALAVAHHAKDLFGVTGHGKLASDLRLLERHGGVTPRALSVRLAEHGLRRVGLVVFSHLADRATEVVRAEGEPDGGAPSWAEYQGACASSAFEAGLASRFAARLASVAARAPRLGFLMVRAVADRPADGATSLALALARLGRDVVKPPPDLLAKTGFFPAPAAESPAVEAAQAAPASSSGDASSHP